jgi:hypothetical protein
MNLIFEATSFLRSFNVPQEERTKAKIRNRNKSTTNIEVDINLVSFQQIFQSIIRLNIK